MVTNDENLIQLKHKILEETARLAWNDELDEDGKENTFEHILTFMYEGKKYVALSPIADEESAMDDDEAEVVLFQITSENGEDTYVSIDNEVLLDEVFAEFLDLMDEINEEEDKNGENE